VPLSCRCLCLVFGEIGAGTDALEHAERYACV